MDKLPPSSIEAEQAVLGSLLIDRDAISKVAPFLRSEDFYRESHSQIYRAIFNLYEKGEPSDFITVCDELEGRSQLEGVGGASYLTALTNIPPTAAHVEYYAQIVLTFSVKRQMINFGGKIAGMGYSDAEPDFKLLQEQWTELTADQKNSLVDVIAMETLLNKDLSMQEPLIGQGLLPHGGRLLLAGAPKLGKSILILQMALSLASGRDWLDIFPITKPHRVLYIDFEWALKVTQDRLKAMSPVFDVPLETLWIASIPPTDILAGGLADIARPVQKVMPNVLIIDTLGKIHTEEENSATAMNRVCNALDQFRLQYHIAGLIIVHHDRKIQPGFIRSKADVQNIRGSSALLGWPESLAIVEMDTATGGRRIGLALRDQRAISQVLTEYDPDTMLSTAQIVSDREIAVPSNKVVALLRTNGGRLLRQSLIAQMKLGGVPERATKWALKNLRDRGKIVSEKSIDPLARTSGKDIVLVEETQSEIKF